MPSADPNRHHLRLQWEDGLALCLHVDAWAALLRLARAHGWTPAGTEPPRDWTGDAWSGIYEPAAEQHVTDDDARALGAALARALERAARGELDGTDLGEAARSITSSEDALGRVALFQERCKKAGFFVLGPLDLHL